jgi:hypothetical protein
MIKLTKTSSQKNVAIYIGQCIALYPKELKTDEVASYIVGLDRFDWDDDLAKKYDSYNDLATLANDMEWQEQPGDWERLVSLYAQFWSDVAG